MARIGPLTEITLYVQDMQKQVSFYCHVMGLKITYPTGLKNYADQFWVRLDSGGCTLALHAGGQRRFGEDAPKIVFRVKDIHSARDALLGAGVRLGEVRTAAPGTWVCDGLDPEGNKISIQTQANPA